MSFTRIAEDMDHGYIEPTWAGKPRLCDAEATEAISKALNTMSVDAYKAGALVSYDHPTLQQKMMHFCVGFLREMARPERRTDARNEGSVELARLLAATMEEHPIALPYI